MSRISRGDRPRILMIVEKWPLRAHGMKESGSDWNSAETILPGLFVRILRSSTLEAGRSGLALATDVIVDVHFEDALDHGCCSS